jgi:hypothetical protein
MEDRKEKERAFHDILRDGNDKRGRLNSRRLSRTTPWGLTEN